VGFAGELVYSEPFVGKARSYTGNCKQVINDSL